MKPQNNNTKGFQSWIPLLMITLAFIFFIACTKDEPEPTTQDTTKPTSTESRTGLNEFVYSDSSSVIYFTDHTDTTKPQRLINLRFVDSITYISPPPYRDLQIQQSNGKKIYCWEYDITFHFGSLTYKTRAFAKYKGFKYTRYPSPGDGWPLDFHYRTYRQTTASIMEFETACLKEKKKFLYEIRSNFEGNQTTWSIHLNSSSCGADAVIFPRQFKRF